MKDFNQYSDLIAKFLAGESSLTEKEELFAWTKEDQGNKAVFEEMEGVWDATADADYSPFEADMDAAWSKIDSGTSSPVVPMPGTKSSGKVVSIAAKRMRWAVAAAVLALVGFSLWNRQEIAAPAIVEIQTLNEETKEVTLPDGSQVWLNENSTLAYATDFTKRAIELKGEAFFDVERMEDRPFTIQSGDATTTVLGTSFNVRAYPTEENIEVTVETGKVALAVTKPGGTSIELPAGSSGIVYKKEEKVERVEEKLSNAIAWKTMKLDFEEDLMIDVITTLERYFGTDIQVSNDLIYDCHFTSPFDRPDLNEILEVVSATIGVEVQQVGGKYMLVGNGCAPNN